MSGTFNPVAYAYGLLIAVLLQQNSAHVWVCIVLEVRHGGRDVTKNCEKPRSTAKNRDVD